MPGNRGGWVEVSGEICTSICNALNNKKKERKKVISVSWTGLAMSLQPCALIGNHEAEETSTAICYFYASPVCHLASIKIFYLWRIQGESNSNLGVDLCVVLPPLPASRNAVPQVKSMTRMTTVLSSFLGARFSCHSISVVWGKNHDIKEQVVPLQECPGASCWPKWSIMPASANAGNEYQGETESETIWEVSPMALIAYYL